MYLLATENLVKSQTFFQWFTTKIWSRWEFHNCLTTLFLLVIIYSLWSMARRENFKIAFGQLKKRPAAIVSFIILCLFSFVGTLDSYGYHHAILDGNGNPLKDKKGAIVEDERGRSLLDLACLYLSEKKESTYSAPLADKSFVKKTYVKNGMPVREFPDLEHPGSHLLGTDKVGRDVFVLSLKGCRTALIIGIMTTLLAIPFSIFFGLASGYFGGWVDDAVQFVYTVLGSIPDILLIVAFVVLYDRGLTQLCIIMGITSWVGLCRLLRGEALKLRELEYIQASRALGASAFSIIRKHLLPNVLHLIVITAVLRFSGLILSEAVLSYLNLGVGPFTESWGKMINAARFELARDPVVWWPMAAAFFMMLGLVLPANLFGDCLRDALDPRLRK